VSLADIADTLEEAMFADSLLDSHWAGRSRRGWATLASFAFEGIALALLLLLPLLYTQAVLPLRKSPEIIVPPSAAEPAPEGRTSVPQGVTIIHQEHPGGLHAPQRIPLQTNTDPDTGPPAVPLAMGNSEGGGCGRACQGVPYSTGNSAAVIPPPPPQEPPVRKPRTSVMMEGSLIHRVEPIYPPPAKAMRIQGTVVLAAIVGREGAIEKLKALSGHPLLVQAALDAVRQWRYRPYVLNGEPLEVETRITVNFVLSR
jgi:protein TonB